MISSYFIDTTGCQMNVADTEQMHSVLRDSGLSQAPSTREADLILVNGCSVREKAVHKAVSALGRWARLKKKEGTGKRIGLGGCVGQLDRGTIFKSQPDVDFVFGPDAIEQLPEMVFRLKHGERHFTYTEFDSRDDYSTSTRINQTSAQAYVNIMKGCDKFCTYCIVPFTRGREKSRKIDEVLDDLAALVARGVREVTLLGQNVNSFGKGNSNLNEREPRTLSNRIGRVGPREGDENFPQLLRAIDSDPRLSEIQRIRFTSSHPLDFSDELIACYDPETGVKRLANHLHLPVQSGSDRILRRMGRHHRIEDYIAQMEALKERRPDVGLSTDLIVGFPTETEEDFQATLDLMDRLEYDNVYAFAYSVRPGTRAEKLEDDVSEDVKKSRLDQVLKKAKQVAKGRYSSRVGKIMDVLVEAPAKNQGLLAEGEDRPAQSEDLIVWSGRSSCNRLVHFLANRARDLKGRFLPVKVTAATSLSLRGELV